jgi:hypothetical protein
MISIVILFLSLIAPGYLILYMIKIKVHTIEDTLFLSYILSLTLMFTLLYIGGHLFFFKIASIIYLLITIFASIFATIILAYKVWQMRPTKLLPEMFLLEDLILVTLSFGLISIYALVLWNKAILDSDVVQYYLPIAREIIRKNGFTYSTGYDFNVFLKPIGVSVLYAWSYFIDGSLISENFRIMPLIPLALLIILNYSIVKISTNSKKIASLSTIIFLLLPFHDRWILFNSFYGDIFYYPLIFSAIYYLIKYLYLKDSLILTWIGLSLGTASLLKAQTIYFLIALLITFVFIKLNTHKKIIVTLLLLNPFLILVPEFFASLRRSLFSVPLIELTYDELGFLFFLSFLSLIVGIKIFRRSTLLSLNNVQLIKFVKELLFLLIPFISIANLWYIMNFLKLGSLIYTSSVDLPNYDWASGILSSMESHRMVLYISNYILYYFHMFVDPSLSGYVILIPLLIGLIRVFFSVKEGLDYYYLLAFFELIASIQIFSAAVTSHAYVYNPRDPFPLAPLITSLIAFGINFDMELSKNKRPMSLFIKLLIITYLGLFSYVHSVFVYYISLRENNTFIVSLSSSLAKIAGLSLRDSSFQLSQTERILFVSRNLYKIFLLAFLSSIPIIVILFLKNLKLRSSREKLNTYFIFPYIYTLKRFKKGRVIASIMLLIIIGLLEIVIIYPRVEMLNSLGGVLRLKETQLAMTYKGLFYNLISGKINLEGNILSYKAPDGLPYYLYDKKIIDLRYPANLAAIKDFLISDNISKTLSDFRRINISYILLNHDASLLNFDSKLNGSLSKLIGNPRYVYLVESFGSWNLYRIGLFEYKSFNITFSDCTTYNSTGNTIVRISEYGIEVMFGKGNADKKVLIMCEIRGVNLSYYDTVFMKINGSQNLRILLRLQGNNSNSLDIIYWQPPPLLGFVYYNLKQFSVKTQVTTIYFSIKIINDDIGYFNLSKIQFIKYKN